MIESEGKRGRSMERQGKRRGWGEVIIKNKKKEEESEGAREQGDEEMKKIKRREKLGTKDNVEEKSVWRQNRRN